MRRERDVLLALDFGTRRIGVASGNLLTRTASPVTTLEARGGPPWTELDRVVSEWRPDLLVIGLPGSDAAREINTAIADFIGELEARYGIPVETVDETLTSAEARSEARAERASGSAPRPVRRARIDQHAACLIAEQWLGAPRTAGRDAGGDPHDEPRGEPRNDEPGNPGDHPDDDRGCNHSTRHEC